MTTARTPVLLVIIGSVRVGRIGDVVARWFAGLADEHGHFDVRVLDLAAVDLPHDLSMTDSVEDFRAQLAAADAFVLVTPEYNHGYPAKLKLALDSAKAEWRCKPMGFVSYGGLAGGARAVEQLRQVAAELHMVTVRDAVLFTRAKKRFDRSEPTGLRPTRSEGGGTDDGAAIDSGGRMIEQLRWWSDALAGVADYPG